MVKHRRLLLSLILFAGTFGVFGLSSAHAATFTVATGNDENTDNASCALSEAIENINNAATTNTDCSPTGAYGTNDTINLPSGTITLTADLATITNEITIAGQGKSTSIIDGDGSHNGFYAEDIIDYFTATDFTFQDAGDYAMGACAVDITIDQVLIDNSVRGAVFDCNAGEYIESVAVTDSDFTNNSTASSNNGTAGLFISVESDPGCGASIDIDISRVRANNNSATYTDGGVVAGVIVVISNDCPVTFPVAIAFEDVEANNNTSSGGAGILFANPNSLTAVVGINRASAIGNTVTGQLNAPTGLSIATAGVGVYGATQLNTTNTTVSGNSAEPSAGSSTGAAGLMTFSLGTGVNADLSLTNVTITDNSLVNSNNISVLPLSGMFAPSSADAVTFTPTYLSNALIAGNTLDGDSSACIESVDFGFGQTDVPMTSGGGNIVDNDTCEYAFDHATDQNDVVGLFATLAAPAYNNGFVQTVALLENSPAIDAGVDVAFAQDAQLLSRSQGTAVDSGAYESPFSAAITPVPDSQDQPDALAESGSYISVFMYISVVAVGAAFAALFRSGRNFRARA